MKRFTEQFKKKADSISLTPEERAGLHARIVTYMEYHPLPVTMKEKMPSPRQTVLREPFLSWVFPAHYLRAVAVGCVAFVVIGVPALAEKAVPGDMLYPMKVRVNEEVYGTFAGSGYEKVAWETKRLERRIAEARLLAKEGRLTTAVQDGVIAAVTAHQAATEAEIETLKSVDADAAALATLTFASVLDVQSAALKADTTGSTTEGVSTVALARALDEAQDQVAATGGAEVSYERLIAQLEIETTRGRELLRSIDGGVTPAEYADVERRLGDVERKVQSGREIFASDTGKGLAALKETWRDTQVLITYLTDIDVRTALAIDTLVPVVPTPDEVHALAVAAYDEATAQLAVVEERLPAADAAIAVKLTASLPQVKTLLETATTTLPTDVGAARVAAEEAREYTRSMVRLTQGEDVALTGDEAVMLLTTMATASTTASTTATSSDDAAVEALVPTTETE